MQWIINEHTTAYKVSNLKYFSEAHFFLHNDTFNPYHWEQTKPSYKTTQVTFNVYVILDDAETKVMWTLHFPASVSLQVKSVAFIIMAYKVILCTSADIPSETEVFYLNLTFFFNRDGNTPLW